MFTCRMNRVVDIGAGAPVAGTAAALVLGTQLEKSLRFSELEQWQEANSGK